MESTTPKIIYRYQSFNALSLDSLCHDELYFSDPSKFNDPLDCSPTVERDSDKKTLQEILESLVVRRVIQEILSSLKNARVNTRNALNHAKKQGRDEAKRELQYISYLATDPNFSVNLEEAECLLLTHAIQSEILKQNNRGICCFSEEFDNPLLWSHYGDQHKGFCVGYSADRKPEPILHKVVYGGDRTVKTSLIAEAILKTNKDAQRELDGKVLLRKAYPWSYEKEWRIFENIGLQASPLKLEEVIFGLRCSPSIMHSVIEALKPREIKFYSIETSGNSFELKRTGDIGEMYAYLPRTSQSGEEIFGPVTDNK